VLALVEFRLKGFDGVAHHGAQIDPLALQPQVAAGDPRHIQEAVGKQPHLADLPIDQCVHPFRCDDIFAVLLAQNGERILDCRQRAAQFMTDQREELVFATIGSDQLLGSRTDFVVDRRPNMEGFAGSEGALNRVRYYLHWCRLQLVSAEDYGDSGNQSVRYRTDAVTAQPYDPTALNTRVF
jgi:hypothetical protein